MAVFIQLDGLDVDVVEVVRLFDQLIGSLPDLCPRWAGRLREPLLARLAPATIVLDHACIGERDRGEVNTVIVRPDTVLDTNDLRNAVGEVGHLFELDSSVLFSDWIDQDQGIHIQVASCKCIELGQPAFHFHRAFAHCTSTQFIAVTSRLS